jgi:hypothetical protein
MLTEKDTAILKELAESETKMIHVVGAQAFIGNSEYPATVAQRFLSMTAIREIDTERGVTRYELTATGRHLLTDPEVQRQLVVAMGIASY